MGIEMDVDNKYDHWIRGYIAIYKLNYTVDCNQNCNINGVIL